MISCERDLAELLTHYAKLAEEVVAFITLAVPGPLLGALEALSL